MPLSDYRLEESHSTSNQTRRLIYTMKDIEVDIEISNDGVVIAMHSSADVNSRQEISADYK